MQIKAPNPIAGLPGGAPLLLKAYFEVNHLKQLYRQGWLRCGLPAERCESVAEHTFGVAVLALLLTRAYFPELDALKALRMALVHDFGEVYAGDITPVDPVSPEEKARLEQASVAQVAAGLPGGDEILALWQEFEAGDSPEAQLVRQLDRLEMGLQAGIYAHQGLLEPDEFYASARQALRDARLVDLLQALTGPGEARA
jgi:putative hydrolase of HD superfamily